MLYSGDDYRYSQHKNHIMWNNVKAWFGGKSETVRNIYTGHLLTSYTSSSIVLFGVVLYYIILKDVSNIISTIYIQGQHIGDIFQYNGLQ